MSSVKLNLHGVPEDIIFNRIKGFSRVHQTYKTVLYSEYMNKLYNSFANRAFWSKDEFGNDWAVLTINTDMIKQYELATQEPWNAEDEYHQHREGFNQPQFPADPTNPTEVKFSQFTHKKQLAPATRVSSINQVAIYRNKLEELKKSASPKSVRQQKRLALKDIPKIDGGVRVLRKRSMLGEMRDEDDYMYREVRRTPINIRSGRLFGAFFPAEIANGRIYAGPDQQIASYGLNFDLQIKVPYADKCEEPIERKKRQKKKSKRLSLIEEQQEDDGPKFVRRILIPPSLQPDGKAFIDSHEKAIRAAKVVYESLLNRPSLQNDRISDDNNRPPAPRRRSY
jgi:hypothetical protein